jgi:hypothetical protein
MLKLCFPIIWHLLTPILCFIWKYTKGIHNREVMCVPRSLWFPLRNYFIDLGKILCWCWIISRAFFNSGSWGYWHCGHSWPIVPARYDRWWWLWRNWWNEDWQGKPKFSEKTCPSATFVHHKIPHDQTRFWTRAAAVGSRRLTAWAMARPDQELYWELH